MTAPDNEAVAPVLSLLRAIRELNGLDAKVTHRFEQTGVDGAPISTSVVDVAIALR